MSDALPDGLHSFLGDTEWEGAEIAPLVGDASFRRYFRLRMAGRSAMLMHAPPPHEDPKPFLQVAHWLENNGMRAPHIFAEDAGEGWVLIEDFGDQRMRERVDDHSDEERGVYARAIDALVRLHELPPGPFEPYDMAVYQREVDLFVEWYCRRWALPWMARVGSRRGNGRSLRCLIGRIPALPYCAITTPRTSCCWNPANLVEIRG